MPQNYVKRILNARIYDLVVETPVDEAAQLSQRLGNRVLLKREDLQPVFSFKLRGAYNKMLCLTEEQLAKGVVAASAGNHAQGLAMAAKKLGVKAIIVMPTTTPQIKVNAVRARGAKVVLQGDTYDEASDYALKLVTEKGMTYIHPFDDPDVIAGQGTIAMEILRQVSGPLDAVFIAVGGGGLAAGMAAYIKYVRPEVKVIAVEPEDAACLDAAMKAGRRVRLKHVGLFADGAAVAQIGKEPFRVLRNTIDEVITVSVDEICSAIKDTFEDTRSICEPAGALGLAGLKKYVERTGVKGQTLLAVDCGANINFDRLRYISERTEIGEKREAILAVTIPEEPGSFKAFCTSLSKRNITEFNYRMGDPAEAHIFVGVQVSGDEDRQQLVADLTDKGYPLVDMTDNEMAKLHIRHMVGGRAPEATEEVVYRFEFPERPAALMNFLNQLGGQWNISMFHYRNHGAAYGRVLVGLQVPLGEQKLVSQFLDQLGYTWKEETQNPAYQFFLS
ncbi:MAG: threonine ammonia-lyase, biosynthetic [Porticoccus sp.]|uniref:threonine ammonia-lyase, biosynthetic n=1 Tax=Porticoccus hydrocarbonoclasticus TaxID=1073414 RepID=UPI000C4F5E49|nr:threonine ammonia-lyase, biosynthetic [Porticoccus hydrocarbonoclasticus]MBG58557.1 threonine ammonia-lyase, biosynthetic [Porticoccus sp.]|tara:strand:+ start:460 stop:1971 length:1512 start_codon:yes stop_codon:yes gene_type:complete